MSAVTTPISGAVARYRTDAGRELRLPVIGLDERDYALVLNQRGRVALASKARPRIDGKLARFVAVEDAR